jgi:putative membrane protein
MKKARYRFIVRWFVCSFGLWIASQLLGDVSISYGERFAALVISGFVLAVANTFVRPLLILLTLPAVLLTMGIFTIVINALMVLLTAWIYKPLEVDGFGAAIVAGLVIGLVNWLVSALVEEK